MPKVLDSQIQAADSETYVSATDLSYFADSQNTKMNYGKFVAKVITNTFLP